MLALEPGFAVEGEPSAGGEVIVEALTRGGEVLATTGVPLAAPCDRPEGPHPGEQPPRVAVGLVAFPEQAVGLRVLQ